MIWPFSTIADLRRQLIIAQEAAIEARAARDAALLVRDRALADKMALAAQLAEACKDRDDLYDALNDNARTLARISDAGAASKNGTARRLAKIARGEA